MKNNFSIYIQSPILPSAIQHHTKMVGWAFEKHRWAFQTNLQGQSGSVFDWDLEKGINGELYLATREQHFFDYLNIGSEGTNYIRPYKHFILPEALPQYPIHKISLYEPDLAHTTNEQFIKPLPTIKESELWRFLEAQEVVYYLVYQKTLIRPLNTSPKRTIDVIKSIKREGQMDFAEGVLAIDKEQLMQTIQYLGIKGYDHFYILAFSPKQNHQQIILQYQSLLQGLTKGKVKVVFSDFHQLVKDVQFLLTTYTHDSQTIYNIYTTYPKLSLFFNPKNILEDIPIDLTIDDETKKNIHSYFPNPQLTTPEKLNLSWRKITTINSLSKWNTLKTLQLDGCVWIYDLKEALKQVTGLENLSIRFIDLEKLDFLAVLPHLQTLNINRLSPQCWSDLTEKASSSLQTLILDEINPIHLPQTPIKLPQIKKLSIKESQIEDLSPFNSMQSLEHLDIEGSRISQLNSFSFAQHLKYLNIASTAIKDIQDIGQLPHLQTLIAGDLYVKDWTPLASLKKLEKLRLPNNYLKNLAFLSDLPLKVLDLHTCEVENIADLSSIETLEELCIAQNQYAHDLEVIYDLKNLKKLNLNGVGGIDYKQLATLDQLIGLDISAATLKQIDWLSKFADLKHLSLYGTYVEDLIPLKNLGALEELNISSCRIQDFTILKHFGELKKLHLQYITAFDNLGVLQNNQKIEYLNLEETSIASLNELSFAKQLKYLNLNNTQINTLDGIENCGSLEYLTLDHTAIQDLQPLQKLPNLKQISICNTLVEDYTPLIELPSLDALVLKHNGAFISKVYQALDEKHVLINKGFCF